MAIFKNNRKLDEISFQYEKDFEDEIFANSKMFFGPRSVLINTKAKLKGSALGSTIPDAFLFDVSDAANPDFYLVEIELAKHSFYNHIFPQITKFFAFFKDQKQRQELTGRLYEIINSDADLKKQLKTYIGGQEIYKFINDVVENSQNILIIIDGEKNEFSEITDVYRDTWGKMVKHLVLRKYSDGEEIVYQLEPDFEILEYVSDEPILKENGGYDEVYHTEKSDKLVSDIYMELKNRLLLINNELLFNPQKNYISVRRKKNLAFLLFRKKKIHAVVMRPEEEIRKEISKYQIHTLSQSVQKFYNGPCADIILDNIDGLDEVVDVFKPLVMVDK